jgi:hypothetical protein
MVFNYQLVVFCFHFSRKQTVTSFEIVFLDIYPVTSLRVSARGVPLIYNVFVVTHLLRVSNRLVQRLDYY